MRPVENIARITLLAFLLNAVLPFLAVYNVPAHQLYAKNISSLFGEKVLICSGDGFKWVTWKDLQEGKGGHEQPSHYKCPLCYLAAHGLKDIIAPGAVAPAGGGYADSGPAAYASVPAALSLHFSVHSRAPPFSFFS